VSPPKSGVGSGIQSKAYQYAHQRLNPRNTLGKKSQVDVSTPVHPVATPLERSPDADPLVRGQDAEALVRGPEEEGVDRQSILKKSLLERL